MKPPPMIYFSMTFFSFDGFEMPKWTGDALSGTWKQLQPNVLTGAINYRRHI